ncbi:MAG: hypothetical protein IKW74_03150, partial [Thermoguttaceae bacterium]|nr:hypothetical protein [Thermoguttaceae bacterium]
CHNSSKTDDTDNVEPVLSGEIQDHFTASYINLKPYLRWYEWGENSIQQVATLPERCGATESPLTKILSDETHRDIPNFTERDRQIISFWLDSNIPFYGVYDPGEQERQQRGEKVELPLLQ